MPPVSTPTGTLTNAEEVFVENAPNIWFGGVHQYAPDADGFYHGITGTAGNPVYEVGCYENFRLQDNVTINELRCDVVGLKKATQIRDYLTVTFDLKSLFPLTRLRHMLRGGAVTWNDSENAEKMGLGEIDNTLFYKVFLSRVYDSDAGDFVSITGHRVQFTGNFQMQAQYGQSWMISGIEMRFYADDDLPDAQRFATIIRVDEDAL